MQGGWKWVTVSGGGHDAAAMFGSPQAVEASGWVGWWTLVRWAGANRALVPYVPECDRHDHRHAQDERNGEKSHLEVDVIAVDEPAAPRAERCDSNEPRQDSQRQF